MEPGGGDFPVLFLVVFAIAGVFILTVFVLVVVSAVRSRRVLRDNGLDPLAAHAQIAARLAHGPLATAAPGLEERLTELDGLRRRGLISEAEHAAARTAALTEPR